LRPERKTQQCRERRRDDGRMANEVRFDVPEKPPLKSLGFAVFNETHGQPERVRALLEAARDAMQEQGFTRITDGGVALEVVTRSTRGDAANIIGGIADVLEDKRLRAVHHLGDLADVWLYRNDRQVTNISYKTEPGECGYTVTVREL